PKVLISQRTLFCSNGEIRHFQRTWRVRAGARVDTDRKPLDQFAAEPAAHESDSAAGHGKNGGDDCRKTARLTQEPASEKQDHHHNIYERMNQPDRTSPRSCRYGKPI